MALRTRVGIIGSGPSGLLLSHLLAQQGIESVILEDRSRAYVEARIRAGVIEHGAVKTLTEAGVADRLHREGMRHDGIYLQVPGERHHLDFPDLCGQSVWVYGQTELTKDLINIRIEAGQQFWWEVSNVQIHDPLDASPRITFTDADGNPQELVCDAIAGCDGFHGVSRESIPESVRTVWQRVYPYSWLGILAEVAPSTDELIYAWHPDGFALHSMRSHSISRLYLQVDPDDVIENWSDDRIWEGLATRLALPGWSLQSGPTLEKSITPMRSFVSAPMRYGNLFLAGDASHIVPPTGAKGLNLAIADVTRLSQALTARFNEGSEALVDAYSDAALRRVWRATHFSWWMTTMMHTMPNDPNSAFDHQMQLAQLDYVTHSRAGGQSLAENYTGYEI